MSDIVKHGLLYLFAVGCGVLVGFFWFGSSEVVYDDRNELIEEIRTLKRDRKAAIKSIVFFDSAFQVEFVRQDKQHEQEIKQLKKSHNEKRNNIRRLPADSTILLFTEATN